MAVHYSEDFKKEIVKAYMAGDKSIQQLAGDFNIAKSSVSKYKEECYHQYNSRKQWSKGNQTIKSASEWESYFTLRPRGTVYFMGICKLL